MNVVDEQGITFSVRFAESAQLTEPHRRRKSVREILRRDEPDLPIGMSLAQADVDSFEQMALARTHRTMKDERIGRLARVFNDAHGRGVGDAVAGPDGEFGQPTPATSASG